MTDADLEIPGEDYCLCCQEPGPEHCDRERGECCDCNDPACPDCSAARRVEDVVDGI